MAEIHPQRPRRAGVAYGTTPMYRDVPIANIPLSNGRKEIILEFKKLIKTGIGSDEWKNQLFDYLHTRDNKVMRDDVDRWIQNPKHNWILANTTELPAALKLRNRDPSPSSDITQKAGKQTRFQKVAERGNAQAGPSKPNLTDVSNGFDLPPTLKLLKEGINKQPQAHGRAKAATSSDKFPKIPQLDGKGDGTADVVTVPGAIGKNPIGQNKFCLRDYAIDLDETPQLGWSTLADDGIKQSNTRILRTKPPIPSSRARKAAVTFDWLQKNFE